MDGNVMTEVESRLGAFGVVVSSSQSVVSPTAASPLGPSACSPIGLPPVPRCRRYGCGDPQPSANELRSDGAIRASEVNADQVSSASLVPEDDEMPALCPASREGRNNKDDGGVAFHAGPFDKARTLAGALVLYACADLSTWEEAKRLSAETG